MINEQFINKYALIEMLPPSYTEISSNNRYSKPDLDQLKTCFRQNLVHFTITFLLLIIAMIVYFILIKLFTNI